MPKLDGQVGNEKFLQAQSPPASPTGARAPAVDRSISMSVAWRVGQRSISRHGRPVRQARRALVGEVDRVARKAYRADERWARRTHPFGTGCVCVVKVTSVE